MNHIRWKPCVTALMVWIAAASAVFGAAFIQNPSFESNFNTNWPYYQQPGWPGATGIDGWTATGGYGVNDRTYDRAGPFHDNGLTPDRSRVAFKQQGGDFSQVISGLTAGKLYWIQFYYNSRGNTLGGNCDIATRFGDQELDKLTGVVRVTEPEGTNAITVPFRARSVPFVASSDSGTLTFRFTTEGDRSALLDAITIVQRETNDVVIMNPSFEASGTLPSVGVLTNLAGWLGVGAVGVDTSGGLYANNGAIPDQDLVAFIEGPGSLTQTVRNLIPGSAYQLILAYNARTGNTPHLQVKSGATVLWEIDVTPVGSFNPFHSQTISFTAANDTLELSFAQTKVGSDAVLIDNVRLQGAAAVPLPPLGITPKRAELAPGQSVTVTVKVPKELLDQKAADITLASANTNLVSLVGAAADGTVTLHFDQTGTGATAPPAGAKLWLKADTLSGVGDGAKLATWADASGNANDATNATTASQPVYIASGLNGQPVVRFADGGNDDVTNSVQWLDSKATVQTKNGQAFSAFIVFRSDDTDVSAGNLAGRDNLLQPLDLEPGTTDNLKRGRTILYVDTYQTGRRIQTVNNQASFPASIAYAPATWTLAGIIQDPTTATCSMYLNGALDTKAAMGPEGGTHGPWRIGASKLGHGGLQGDVAEILVYDRALNAAEQEQLQSYLIGKWKLPGVTTKTVDAVALRRGSTSVNVTDSAGLEISNNVIINITDSFVRNPSFDAEPAPSGAGYGPILAWNTTGGVGVNRVGQPFAIGSGLIPDRLQVAFIQGVGAISQQVAGLTPGSNYRLQFRYSLRNNVDPNGPAIDLTVKFAGQTLVNIANIVPPLDGNDPYEFVSTNLVPAVASGLLEFVTSNPKGDASVLLDAVNLVKRSSTELVVQNPSFEASGTMDLYITGPIAGWEFSGGGCGTDGDGPFSNGVTTDQDQAFFMQGAGSIQQMISGFVPGQNYTLSYAVNARDFPPNQGTTHHTVLVGTPAFPTVLVDEDVIPVTGTGGYLENFLVFMADDVDQIVRFEHAPPPGDRTLLLDNVRVLVGEVGPPPVLTASLQPNGSVRITWPAPATGYFLQSAPAVTGSYTNDPALITTEGQLKVVTVQPVGNARFYRLAL